MNSIRSALLKWLIVAIFFSVSCRDNSIYPSLDGVFERASEMVNLKALIVWKKDRIVREEYFNSGHPDSAHDVRSVTKSVMATLIGIAIDHELIASEDQVIGEFLEPLVGAFDSAKAKIKISDILSMTSGLEGDELADLSEYNNWALASDQLTYTLSKPLIHAPGQVFTYNSGVAHLSSAIITQATSMSTFQFAKDFLFTPLGITDHHWETDNRGIFNGGAGLELTPHDMLKLGRLYLQQGVYNGERIISETWIDNAVTSKIAAGDATPFGPEYGYYWWNGHLHSHDYYFANGWGGQFIVIVPDIELIVVATNRWSGVSSATARQQWYDTIDMIMNGIVVAYD